MKSASTHRPPPVSTASPPGLDGRFRHRQARSQPLPVPIRIRSAEREGSAAEAWRTAVDATLLRPPPVPYGRRCALAFSRRDSTLKRLRPDIGEEGALRGARQPLERGIERQPVDRADIVHQFAGLLCPRFHPPVMHDLGASAGLIDQRAEKLVHGDIVPGLFQHLALGGGARRLAVIELALRQHPLVALAQAHHRDQRRLLPPQHNASRRQNRHSRHRLDFTSAHSNRNFESEFHITTRRGKIEITG